MIQTWWRSRSSNNPVVMMIQTRWWSRCDDDPYLMMIQIEWWSSNDEPIVIMMQISWWRRLEDKEDLKTKEDLKMMRWSSWCKEEDQCWKLCRNTTFLVKRECWCIYNFRMYSSMYLMSCNPMFILGCIYYVIESCCHAHMFQSGGSIM